MKTWMILPLIVMVSALVAGCGGGGSPTDSVQAPSPSISSHSAGMTRCRRSAVVRLHKLSPTDLCR